MTLDEISQEPKRDFRLPSWRWLVAAAAACVIAATAALVVTGGGRHHAAASPGTSALPSARGRSPAAAPGTVLLTCASATRGQLGPDWRAQSLRAGPLWFADSRQTGYVHNGVPRTAAHATQRPGLDHLVVMIVEVASGSTVVMKPAASARSYLRFVNGFHPGGSNQLPAGDSGFTFVSCPRGHAGANGRVTDFYLGFSIQAGHAAGVEVWPSASSRPIRVTFTCPGSICAG